MLHQDAAEAARYRCAAGVRITPTYCAGGSHALLDIGKQVALVRLPKGMVSGMHLDNAPISEAVLDIFVDGVELKPSALRAFGAEVQAEYPEEQQRRLVQSGLALDTTGAATTSARVSEQGFQYRSTDGLDVVQARIDGFTVNRLRPYRTWEVFVGVARRWWPEYVKVAQPVAVRAVGLRYINDFAVPSADGLFDRDEVARFLPNTPQALTGEPLTGVDGFLERVSYRTSDGDRAVITTVSKPPQDGTIGFILDVEVACDGPWEPGASEFWSALGRLRNLKNKLFLDSISVELRKDFK